MSSKKKNQKTNPNKRKNDETVIICPYCGGTHFEYTAEKRRVPSKWYVHVITAIVIIGICNAIFLYRVCHRLRRADIHAP